ncbi:hypothetical protein, partial [Parvibaculum sp.]|uniref:hypothetical protein n=1 Tax=Parvibaculum sp. TaxID=2024848 RepID=UPI0025E323C6
DEQIAINDQADDAGGQQCDRQTQPYGWRQKVIPCGKHGPLIAPTHWVEQRPDGHKKATDWLKS